MRVIVMGASGYVGSHLVPRLIAAGHEVRASARVAEVLSGRGWDAELVSADALRPETLGAALDGVDIVYYLVHSMAAGRDFAALDREAAANVRDAAARDSRVGNVRGRIEPVNMDAGLGLGGRSRIRAWTRIARATDRQTTMSSIP